MSEIGHNSMIAYQHFDARPVVVPTRRTTPIADRFWAKVHVRGRDECWPWTGAGSGGYGQIVLAGARVGAHRVAVVLSGRALMPGQVVDHLCRNPCCVNPHHLEVVPMAENTRRGILPQIITAKAKQKTHCKRGHPLFGANLVSRPNGSRMCRECQAVKASEWAARNRDRINILQRVRRAAGGA